MSLYPLRQFPRVDWVSPTSVRQSGVKLEQSDISEIERQVRCVKDYELDAISKVLDIDPVWLLRGNS